MILAHSLDLITIGRCSVDLYGQQVGGRLEDMASFAKYVGGCPANIAIGASRLGLRAGFISRVGDEHMGRFIRETLQREGLDTLGLVTDPERLTALVVLGIRDAETFPLIFYREKCPDMALNEGDIDPHYIASAKAVVLSGTHFTTPSVEAASRKAAEIARAAHGRVVFDIAFRPVLWGLTGHSFGEERYMRSDRVTEHLQSILPLCDLVVGTEEEIRIAGGSTDTLAAIQAIRARSDAVIVCKRGPMGCVVFPDTIPDTLEDGITGPGFPIEVYNVVGAGDAFMSGFLRGWLRDQPYETCCKFANACGAFAVSRHGCAPAIPSWAELSYFLDHGSPRRALRTDARLNQIHWSTTRRRAQDRLLAFAIDHRSQFEVLAKRHGADFERIGRFKTLALKAARGVAGGRDGFGIFLDNRFGKEALCDASDANLWIGRPIEVPGSRPLAFEEGPDLGAALLEWPAVHTVKCLVLYHPDDPEDLRTAQETEVARLFDACRKTGHELLLEVIASRHGTVDDDTIARVLERFYALGVYPDWWKLEPSARDGAWAATCETIERHDPYCGGIVLLGLEAPEEELLSFFVVASRYPLVKGFAIGRTLFNAAAEAWFDGTMGDKEAVREMAARFKALVEGWERATAPARRMSRGR